MGGSAPATPTADARPARGRDFRGLLAELTALEHITGGLIVAPDGLLIAARLPAEIPVEPLSALAASLGRELELCGPQIRRGTFIIAEFATAGGVAAVGSTPIGFIVLLGRPGASWEAIRSALRAAVGAVHRAWPG